MHPHVPSILKDMIKGREDKIWREHLYRRHSNWEHYSIKTAQFSQNLSCLSCAFSQKRTPSTMSMSYRKILVLVKFQAVGISFMQTSWKVAASTSWTLMGSEQNKRFFSLFFIIMQMDRYLSRCAFLVLLSKIKEVTENFDEGIWRNSIFTSRKRLLGQSRQAVKIVTL